MAADNLLLDQRDAITEWKTYIMEYLPAAYPRHSSTHLLQGYKIGLSVQNESYVATAVAELRPPPSLADDFDILLEDVFVEVSGEDPFDALERMWVEVVGRVQREKRDAWSIGGDAREYGAYILW